MTGPGHYAEAEKYLALLDENRAEGAWIDGVKSGEIGAAMAAAQVHATLALAAATALKTDAGHVTDWDQWREVTS